MLCLESLQSHSGDVDVAIVLAELAILNGVGLFNIAGELPTGGKDIPPPATLQIKSVVYIGDHLVQAGLARFNEGIAHPHEWRELVAAGSSGAVGFGNW